MYDVLKDYARFLGMEIMVHTPGPVTVRSIQTISVNEHWRPVYDPASLAEHFTAGNNRYDIVMGIGPGSHEIYQSRS